MTSKQLADATRKALEAYNRLTPKEQVRRLVKRGTIDEKGNVLMGMKNK